METWKDIEGYDGKYQVSDLGNVRSLNWKGTSEVRLLNKRFTNAGYHKVLLSKNGVCKYSLVHRLVAEAFIPNPEGKQTVNHIDEVKTNNNVSNLEWCSLRENIDKYFINHSSDIYEKRRATFRKNARAVSQIGENGEVVRVWSSVAEIHNTMNYNNWSISQCCDGKRKKAYGYSWEYAV